MTLLPIKNTSEKDDWVTVDVCDVIKSLGLTDGTQQRTVIKKAFKEAAASRIILLETETDYKDKAWFMDSDISKKENTAKLKFHPDIAQAVRNIKGFSQINLLDLGKLQSQYAIRYYEIAMSYSGFEGKNGNKNNNWYFEKDVKELRELFSIADNKYKNTNNFRRKIVDYPITEINESDIGLRIEVEYIRKGRTLTGFIFNCSSQGRKVKTVSPATELETELYFLRERYSKEWNMIYQEFLKQPFIFEISQAAFESKCRGDADGEILKKYGNKK